MKYVSVLLLALAPLAFANPVVVTIVNEFGFDGQGLGWMELHAEPASDPWDLSGWQIQTNTSVCTLACELGQDGFLIVDSASLAAGGYGHGSFRLNPNGDRIRLQPDSTHDGPADSVVFPVPGWRAGAPMPPAMGSGARLNLVSDEQLITWYIDSTPTPEADNDNYSSVAGMVTWPPSRSFYRVDVVVSGPMGGSYSGVVASGQSYLAQGLSAGRYEVTARGQPGNVVLSYPDSVDVGYNATLSGINIEFDPYGLHEGPSPQAPGRRPAATVIRSLPQGAVAFDAMGRRVVNPNSGILFVREPSAVGGRPSAVTRVVVAR